jgi:hypothetical protein
MKHKGNLFSNMERKRMKFSMTHGIIGLLVVLLLVSMYCHLQPDELWVVSMTDANTRPTYATFHAIHDAQRLATGQGVKVGILGKYFGTEQHQEMYAGAEDFADNPSALRTIAEHGFWMATTLKEIAPDVEIYALNVRDSNREKERDAIIAAIQWAIGHDLDILTYSAEAFRAEDRASIDAAVHEANEHHIVTTFIHYDFPENVLPFGFFQQSPESYAREADVNIFHFDYNLLLLSKYKASLKGGQSQATSIGERPYFSNSSMSPVLAGVVAMMKEVDNTLSVDEYKRILVESSHPIIYQGYTVPHVVDAVKALEMVSRGGVGHDDET